MPGVVELARRRATALGGLTARAGAKVGRISERSAICALAVIVMACTVVVVRHGSGVSSGSDGSGYYNLARLLASGHSTWELRPVAGVTMSTYNPSIFGPLGFSPGKGPGEVAKKNIGSESGWGDLPPKEREEAIQQIGRDFPPHYRDAIEQYFRRLAAEKND